MGYQQIRGWFDFHDIYDQALDEAGPADTLIEVGVAYGRSLAYLARRAMDAGNSAQIIGIDRWLEPWGDDYRLYEPDAANPYDAFVRQMRAHAPEELDRVKVLQLESAEAAQLLARTPGVCCSFVWIDAKHTYDSVKADIAAWLPLVKPGGLLGGHDHTAEFPGVQQAVREAFGADGYQVRGSSWLRRV